MIAFRRFAISVLVTLLLVGKATAEEIDFKSLVHALLKVQDRVAQGDEAALPLQTHLMTLIDASISEIGRDRKLTTKEIDGLLVYAIVGTGSDIVLDVLHQALEQNKQIALVAAVIEYRKRNRRKAIRLFKGIEEVDISARVAPFIYFARGNLFARSSPKEAVGHYDFVRVLAPGTLLEEATLRRLLALHIVNRDAVSFIRIAKQYARRFIRSPYRQQYLAVLKTGIMSLRRRMDNEQVEELAKAMEPRFAASFYMHIIRGAVVSGHLKLATFALERLVDLASTNKAVVLDDSQMRLLTVLTNITQGNPRETQERLAAIDPKMLQPADRRLLAAAKRIAATLSAPLEAVSTDGETSENEIPQGDATVEDPLSSADQNEEAEKDVTSSTPSSDAMEEDTSEAAVMRGDDAMKAFIDDTADRLRKIDSILGE